MKIWENSYFKVCYNSYVVKINVDDEYNLRVAGITYLYLSMIGCVIASVSNVLQM